MTMATYSLATSVGPERQRFSAASPKTFTATQVAPRTPEEASALLSRAERIFRSGVTTEPLLELTRFLGANSHAWTPANRARLRRVIAGFGTAAIDAVVTTMHAHPRTDILDEAELVLRGLPPDSIGRVRRLVAEQSLLPGVRACLLRAAVRAGGPGTAEVLYAALNDVEPELREGAASLVSEFDIPNGRTMLERRLARETNTFVKDTIRETLTFLARY